MEIIGIPVDLYTQLINQELNHNGFLVNSVTPLFCPGRCVARNAFMVNIRKVGNYQSIYNLDHL